MFSIFLHSILLLTWEFSKKTCCYKWFLLKSPTKKTPPQLSPSRGQILSERFIQFLLSKSPSWPPKLLVKPPKAGHWRENQWFCPQGPWEDTSNFPFHAHKERNSFINCWWNVRGILQGMWVRSWRKMWIWSICIKLILGVLPWICYFRKKHLGRASLCRIPWNEMTINIYIYINRINIYIYKYIHMYIYIW